MAIMGDIMDMVMAMDMDMVIIIMTIITMVTVIMITIITITITRGHCQHLKSNHFFLGMVMVIIDILITMDTIAGDQIIDTFIYSHNRNKTSL